MPEIAAVFTVMLSGPSDVSREFEIVNKVISDWNAKNLNTANRVFIPLDWKRNAPAIMGQPPQENINKNVLDKCDILFAFFWTKVGTATEEEISGTVEEIKRHVGNGKFASIFFSKKDISPSKIDPEQLKQLNELKESFGNQGLYGEYATDEELKDQINKQLHYFAYESDEINEKHKDTLAAYIHENVTFPSFDSEEDEKSELSDEAKFLLVKACSYNSGFIIVFSSIQGSILNISNRYSIGPFEKDRDAAKWKKAINDLEDTGMTEPSSDNPDLFEITDQGYTIADDIIEEDPSILEIEYGKEG